MTVVQPAESGVKSSGPRRIRTWSLRGLVATLAILVPTTTLAIVVSPFGDVDPSNTFFNNIVNMANSGITSGCGGGNFCPKDPVTREQMAAFLNRAAPRASGADFNFPLGSSTQPSTGDVVASVSVTSLNNEYLFLSSTLYSYTYTDAGTFPCENAYAFYVDGSQAGVTSMYSRVNTQPTGNVLEMIGGQTLTQVGPGSHTVELRYSDGAGGCRNVPGRGNLTAQVIPFAGNLGSISALSPTPLAPTSGSVSSAP